MVDGVLPGVDQLGDGHHRVAVVDERSQNPGQGLRRVQRGVVEQHDAARPHLRRDPVIDRVRIVVLPVQAVRVPNKGKPLWHKGYAI